MAISHVAFSLAATFAAGALTIGGLTVNTAQAATAPGAAPAAAAAATIYVSPLGTGSACTVTAPCGITAAKTAVESAIRRGESSAKDIDVDLFGGTYHVPGGLPLGPADSGSNGHDVVWQAVPGQARHQRRPPGHRLQPVSTQARTSGVRRSPRRQRPPAASSCSSTASAPSSRAAPGAPPGVTVTATGFSTTDAAYASFTSQRQIEVVDDSDWKHMSCPVQSITAAPGGGSDINILPSCWQANNLSVPNLGFPV